jgi:hypothetical protein
MNGTKKVVSVDFYCTLAYLDVESLQWDMENLKQCKYFEENDSKCKYLRNEEGDYICKCPEAIKETIDE